MLSPLLLARRFAIFAIDVTLMPDLLIISASASLHGKAGVDAR